jgi:SAM-dependent methyltransferase
MPHSAIDFSARAQLTELLDDPCSREVLRAYLRSLGRTNRWTFAYRPLLAWLESMKDSLSNPAGPVSILDVGSGYGDGLRRVEQWAGSHGIAVELTGLDLNPDATAIAAEASPAWSRIQWVTADVFAYVPPRPVHLIVSSLFTHHLSQGEIVRFLGWMERHAQRGWFINDLSRGAGAYHFFRIFSKLAAFHRHVQHDGPISIARSFVAQDWRELCSAAGIGGEAVRIEQFKPGRLCVSRSKPR